MTPLSASLVAEYLTPLSVRDTDSMPEGMRSWIELSFGMPLTGGPTPKPVSPFHGPGDSFEIRLDENIRRKTGKKMTYRARRVAVLVLWMHDFKTVDEKGVSRVHFGYEKMYGGRRRLRKNLEGMTLDSDGTLTFKRVKDREGTTVVIRSIEVPFKVGEKYVALHIF
jgi:hypothetical protein